MGFEKELDIYRNANIVAQEQQARAMRAQDGLVSKFMSTAHQQASQLIMASEMGGHTGKHRGEADKMQVVGQQRNQKLQDKVNDIMNEAERIEGKKLDSNERERE